MSYTYKYPRPMVTVDILLFNKVEDEVFILLIKRLNEPFKNKWAFPGGFVDKDEDLPTAAERELFEETAVGNVKLQQFKTFGKPGRDPRGHTISIVYYSIESHNKIHTKAGDDAKETQWFNIKQIHELAFDHAEILESAIQDIL